MSKLKASCGARTRRGTNCMCKALANGKCKLHGGMSTGPRTPEGRARIAAAQRARHAAIRVLGKQGPDGPVSEY